MCKGMSLSGELVSATSLLTVYSSPKLKSEFCKQTFSSFVFRVSSLNIDLMGIQI
jgi:hypothetical protein